MKVNKFIFLLLIFFTKIIITAELGDLRTVKEQFIISGEIIQVYGSTLVIKCKKSDALYYPFNAKEFSEFKEGLEAEFTLQLCNI